MTTEKKEQGCSIGFSPSVFSKGELQSIFETMKKRKLQAVCGEQFVVPPAPEVDRIETVAEGVGVAAVGGCNERRIDHESGGRGTTNSKPEKGYLVT